MATAMVPNIGGGASKVKTAGRGSVQIDGRRVPLTAEGLRSALGKQPSAEKLARALAADLRQ